MGGLGSFILAFSLGVPGQSADAAPPAEVIPPLKAEPMEMPETAARTDAPARDETPAKADAPEQSPAPAIEYLKAGIQFFNAQQYDKAGPYFAAAQRFREQLKEKERIVLDVYRDELASYQTEVKLAATLAATPDPDVQRTSRVTNAPEKAAGPRSSQPAPAGSPPKERVLVPTGQPRSALATRSTLDNDKQEARWLLHEAREQVLLGHLDEAAKKVQAARAMNVKWTRFEDTPDKVAKLIEYARTHKPATPKAKESAAHDLPTALTRLEVARLALEKKQPDRAEAIAREVQSWGLDFRGQPESPDLVLKAVRSARLAETLRQYGTPSPTRNPPTPPR